MFTVITLNAIVCAIIGLTLLVLRTKPNSAVSCAHV